MSLNMIKGCSKSKKTFCPKRLRKQLNTEEFKQFYFELVPSSDTITSPTLKKEPDNNSHSDSDKYMLMSFQYEASEQEKMRRAIHQCSTHFHVSSYVHHSKRKKLKNTTSSAACADSTCSKRCSSPIASTTSSDISNIFSNHSSNNSTNSVIQSKPVSSFTFTQSNIIFKPTNYLPTQQTSNCHSYSSTQSSGLMLSLDYEEITDILLEENSPFSKLLKTPIDDTNLNKML